MGRTWQNLDADPVRTAGYYWNERLKKLARLGLGEKLPRGVGPWRLIAREHEASSSEVAKRVFDAHPGLPIDDFTYTTTTPLPRRLPMGDPVRSPPWLALATLAVFAVGLVFGRLANEPRAR